MNNLEALQAALKWLRVFVQGDPSRIDSILSALDSSLPAGWRRDSAIEDRVRNAGVLRAGDRCYSFTDPSGTPVVAVWLDRTAPDCLKGGQTMPLGARSRSNNSQQYQPDVRVGQFLTEIFAPVVHGAGLNVEESPPPDKIEEHLSSHLSSEAKERLQEFADRLTKNPTQLCPDDRQRWNAFVIAIHEGDDVYDPEVLHDWLARNGLSSALADELIAEAIKIRTAFRQYDESRKAAWR